jgi:predicted acylesterase/phospholipase RssA
MNNRQTNFTNLKSKVDSKSIGIAFGAGGARGIAHLLMIEALDELGVKPSIISGSSIGAVVGAFYAAGFTEKEMKEILDQLINPKSDSVFYFLLKFCLSELILPRYHKLPDQKLNLLFRRLQKR